MTTLNLPCEATVGNLTQVSAKEKPFVTVFCALCGDEKEVHDQLTAYGQGRKVWGALAKDNLRMSDTECDYIEQSLKQGIAPAKIIQTIKDGEIGSGEKQD